MAIITNGIRNSVKMGDAKMVWGGINRLRNKQIQTIWKIILKKTMGGLTGNDDEVLEEMEKYIKHKFHQERENIEIGAIEMRWANSEDWEMIRRGFKKKLE